MSKEKIIAISAGIILLAAVIAGIILINTNSTLKSGLDNEKLRNETLLSEKLLLDKEILQFKNGISLLSDKNAQTEKLLADAHLKLSEKERNIAGLQKENATVKSLRKQLAESKGMNEELQNKSAGLTAKNKSLESENQQLQMSVAQLQTEHSNLLKQVELARAELNMKADNYQVDIYKNAKKEIPTFKAKRMKMMSVIIDVPKGLDSDVSFTITTPDGTLINEKSKSLSWKVVKINEPLTASVNSFDDFTVSRQVNFTYSPSSKMKTGIYKIGILSDGKNIGNYRVRLR